MFQSLFDSSVQTAVLERLSRLHPDSPSRWGRMSPHEAICHLADSFTWALGRRETSTIAGPPLPPWLLKLIALKLPIPWPKGTPTTPENDQEQGGTPPTDFEADRGRLEAVIREFSDWPKDRPFRSHPLFKEMRGREESIC